MKMKKYYKKIIKTPKKYHQGKHLTPQPVVPELVGNDMKTAAQGMHEMIANLEMQFNGRSANECIIDPIAVFTEL